MNSQSQTINEHCDVLIIGSGASGLIAAILLARSGLDIIVTTKDAVTESSSLYSQGGIAVPLLDGDSAEQHIQDTLKVGQGLCNEKAVRFYINSIRSCIEELDSWGVPFIGFHNKHLNNPDSLGKEGAHSHKRILKVGGDISGRHLMKSLWEIACRHPNISISQGTSLVKLVKNVSGEIVGGVFQDINQNLFNLIARQTILATGGLSSLYGKSTNPFVSTGDGISVAYQAGASIEDLEFIQFHPTALDHPTCFLLSEALRGEGGILVNELDERFISKYAPVEMELAQRSIVSYAIWKEAQKGHKTYLDLRHLGADFLKTRFSGIYASCLTLGFDLTTDLIPVSPAAHYTIGGIKVDLEMKTNLIGLRAIGEVTRTGLHGADRLASNSLLECIVSAFTVAKSLENELQKNKKVDLSAINEPTEVNESGKRLGEYEIRKIFDELKTNMWNFASFNREDKLLKKLIIWIDEVLSKLPNGISSNTSINQLHNNLISAKLLAEACLRRKESLGCHQRESIDKVFT
jgi:L-aspartate oxidase